MCRKRVVDCVLCWHLPFQEYAYKSKEDPEAVFSRRCSVRDLCCIRKGTVLSVVYDHGVIARSIHFNWPGNGLITKGGVLNVSVRPKQYSFNLFFLTNLVLSSRP